VLNAYTHGNIPQNRERVFIVGFQNKEQCENFSFPSEISLQTQIKDLIDFQKDQEKKYYYSPDNHGYYSQLAQTITKKNTIYQ
jgi:DNA (cytosine-5)-methyltransferase 1